MVIFSSFLPCFFNPDRQYNMLFVWEGAQEEVYFFQRDTFGDFFSLFTKDDFVPNIYWKTEGELKGKQ